MEFHELRIYPTVPAQCFPQCFTLFVFGTSTGETVRIKENLQQKSGVKRVNTNILQILIRGITWSETGDPAWDWERGIHHAAECSSVKFTKIYWLFRKKTAFSPCPGWYFSSFRLLFNSLQLPVQETPHKWWNCSCWIYFSEDTAHFKGFFSLFRQLQRPQSSSPTAAIRHLLTIASGLEEPLEKEIWKAAVVSTGNFLAPWPASVKNYSSSL